MVPINGPTRSFVRVAFIAVFTISAMLLNGADLLLPWHPFSTYGFAATRGGDVTAVDRIASQGGLRAGDRINIKRLTPVDRININFLPLAPEGAVLRLPLTSGRQVAVVSHTRPRSLADNVTDILGVLALLIYIGIAATLVLLRPTPATWAFYLFSYWFCFQGTLAFEYGAPAVLVAGAALTVVATAVSPFALVVFALRFPDATPTATAAKFERFMTFGVAPVFTLLVLAQFSADTFGGVFQPVWLAVLNRLELTFFAVGVITLLARYVNADRETRPRLQWIVAAFSVAFVPIFVLNSLLTELGIFPPVWIINSIQTWSVLAPVAVAYTVLRHRLFDIRLVFSRALLYGLVTSVIIGILALVDWAFGRWLAESRFALVGELALALLLGVGITLVHRRIEQSLNRIIFRAQVLALEAIRRFGHEVDLISDPQRLLGQTYEALHTRLECEYVGVYTAEGSSFALSAPAASPLPAILPNDDFAVLRMRRWGEPFECDEPHHALRAALFVPMTARTQLVGFLVCGPKRDRTHYLPEEIETLSALAHRTGGAYAWLTLRETGPLTPVTTQFR